MTVWQGDCRVLLPQVASGSIQLVYLDPPFFTQKSHSLKTRDNRTEYSFDDRWDSRDEYLAFMRQVLSECQRVLHTTGSLFLHCDKSASHYLRLLLDEVLGEENFQSEIIWAYKRWSNAKKGLLNAHQTLFFYSQSADFKFNTLYTDYSPTTNVDQILQARARNGAGKSVYQRDEDGNIVLGGEKKGVPLSDVWQIPYLNPKAKERAGYPTQKPILLLERIIQMSTDEGDCVLDPFCGSGTTLVAAQLLGRRFVGMDRSPEAVALSHKRLIEPVKSDSQLLMVGEGEYLAKTARERALLQAMNAVPVERNSGIDGFLRFQVDGLPVAIRIQKENEDIEGAKRKLIAAAKTKHCRLMILIRTHHRHDALFPMAFDDDHVLVMDAYDLVIDDWLRDDTRLVQSFDLAQDKLPQIEPI